MEQHSLELWPTRLRLFRGAAFVDGALAGEAVSESLIVELAVGLSLEPDSLFFFCLEVYQSLVSVASSSK